MTRSLLSRTECPVCCVSISEASEIYRLGYDSSILQNYLRTFYEPQGCPEPDRVADEDFIVLRCSGCSLIYQAAVPTDLFALELYERWICPDRAYQLDRESRALNYEAKLAVELVKYMTRLRERRPLRVLDFGMGWGEWAFMARGFGCEVSGVELSEARRSHARQHGIGTVDIEDLPEGYFDVIHTEQVFEHLVHPRPTLTRLRQSLAPGGLLKINVPNGADIEHRLRSADWSAPKGTPSSLNAVAPLEHINCFSHDSLLRLGQEAGLVPVKFTLTQRYSAVICLDGSASSLAKEFLTPMVHHLRKEKGTNVVFTVPSSESRDVTTA